MPADFPCQTPAQPTLTNPRVILGRERYLGALPVQLGQQHRRVAHTARVPHRVHTYGAGYEALGETGTWLVIGYS